MNTLLNTLCVLGAAAMVHAGVSTSSGTFIYSYPVHSFSTSGGINYQVALSYSSNIQTVFNQPNTETQESWAGLGWRLPVSRIQLLHGNTCKTTDDRFSITLPDGSTDELLKSNNGFCLKQYRAWRFELFEDSDGRRIQGWRITDQHGVVYRYGMYDDQTVTGEYNRCRISDGTCVGGTEVIGEYDATETYQMYPVQWLLAEIRDPDGKTLTFSYTHYKQTLGSFPATYQYTRETHPASIKAGWSGNTLEFTTALRNTNEYGSHGIAGEYEYYEKRYLSGISVYKDDPALYVDALELTGYTFTSTCRTIADYQKRYLDSISKSVFEGTDRTDIWFMYNEVDGSDPGSLLDNNPGALIRVEARDGSTEEITYAEREYEARAVDPEALQEMPDNNALIDIAEERFVGNVEVIEHPYDDELGVAIHRYNATDEAWQEEGHVIIDSEYEKILGNYILDGKLVIAAEKGGHQFILLYVYDDETESWAYGDEKQFDFWSIYPGGNFIIGYHRPITFDLDYAISTGYSDVTCLSDYCETIRAISWDEDGILYTKTIHDQEIGNSMFQYSELPPQIAVNGNRVRITMNRYHLVNRYFAMPTYRAFPTYGAQLSWESGATYREYSMEFTVEGGAEVVKDIPSFLSEIIIGSNADFSENTFATYQALRCIYPYGDGFTDVFVDAYYYMSSGMLFMQDEPRMDFTGGLLGNSDYMDYTVEHELDDHERKLFEFIDLDPTYSVIIIRDDASWPTSVPDRFIFINGSEAVEVHGINTTGVTGIRRCGPFFLTVPGNELYVWQRTESCERIEEFAYPAGGNNELPYLGSRIALTTPNNDALVFSNGEPGYGVEPELNRQDIDFCPVDTYVQRNLAKRNVHTYTYTGSVYDPQRNAVLYQTVSVATPGCGRTEYSYLNNVPIYKGVPRMIKKYAEDGTTPVMTDDHLYQGLTNNSMHPDASASRLVSLRSIVDGVTRVKNIEYNLENMCESAIDEYDGDPDAGARYRRTEITYAYSVDGKYAMSQDVGGKNMLTQVGGKKVWECQGDNRTLVSDTQTDWSNITGVWRPSKTTVWDGSTFRTITEYLTYDGLGNVRTLKDHVLGRYDYAMYGGDGTQPLLIASNAVPDELYYGNCNENVPAVIVGYAAWYGDDGVLVDDGCVELSGAGLVNFGVLQVRQSAYTLSLHCKASAPGVDVHCSVTADDGTVTPYGSISIPETAGWHRVEFTVPADAVASIGALGMMALEVSGGSAAAPCRLDEILAVPAETHATTYQYDPVTGLLAGRVLPDGSVEYVVRNRDGKVIGSANGNGAVMQSTYTTLD